MGRDALHLETPAAYTKRTFETTALRIHYVRQHEHEKSSNMHAETHGQMLPPEKQKNITSRDLHVKKLSH
jgi:hypothetical protein